MKVIWRHTKQPAQPVSFAVDKCTSNFNNYPPLLLNMLNGCWIYGIGCGKEIGGGEDSNCGVRAEKEDCVLWDGGFQHSVCAVVIIHPRNE